MGLPLDKPGDMLTSVLAECKARKRITDFSMDLVKQAAGSKYRNDWQTPEKAHENHAHEWRTNMVPHLVDGAPQLSDIRSGSLSSNHPAVTDLTKVMNCWSQASNVADVLLQCADDVQFNFCCALVSTEFVPLEPGDDIDIDEEISKGGDKLGIVPKLHRISPWRFFADTQTVGRGPRYMGHIGVEDKDSLAKIKLPNGKPMYDAEVLKSVIVDDEVRALLREVGIEVEGTGIDRDQVVVYQFYVPETGMTYTLASTPTGSGKGKYLCKPQPYKGLKSGPYIMGGIYMLPDQTYPVAPLAILHDLSLEVNRHRAQASEDAGRSKSVMIVDADPQAIGKISSAMNGQVLGIPGFKGAATEVRTQGASPDQIAYIQMLNGVIEKVTGLTANSAGENTGDTASEAQIVQQARNMRVEWSKKMFKGFVQRCFRPVAWQFWNNPRARMAINHTDPVTGEETIGEYQGGDGLRVPITDPQGQPIIDQKTGQPKTRKVPFSDLHLNIDTYSIGSQDDAVKTMQLQKITETLLANVPTMVQAPFVRWEKLFNDNFEQLGKKGAFDKYVDSNMLKAFQAPAVMQAMQAQMMMQQQMAMMQQGMDPTQMGAGQPGAGGPPQQAQLPPGGGTPHSASPPSKTKMGSAQQGQALRLTA